MLLLAWWSGAAWIFAQTNALPSAGFTNNLIVMIEGRVEVARPGSGLWVPGSLNQVLLPGDRVRTGERSRAVIFLVGGRLIKKSELSEIEIPPSLGLTFKRGLFHIFSRSRMTGEEYSLPSAVAAIRGTEFLVRVKEEASEVTVLDGEVELRTSVDRVDLKDQERASVDREGSIRRSAVLEARNQIIQWSLYYPAVIDIDEVQLSDEERRFAALSLDAYRAGDLLQALAAWPWEAGPTSDGARIYEAALLLSVGQVEKAQALLDTAQETELVWALRRLIAAVRLDTGSSKGDPTSASGWLAESYGRQLQASAKPFRDNVEEALAAARSAVAKSRNFGFGWARVAELEFCRGDTRKAREALEEALRLSPRNPQALALKGFVLSAQNKTAEAISWFDRAIAVDSGLGNAWLGRGLCLIRERRPTEGLRNILIAVSIEPQRSLFRSYLGKALAETGDYRRAEAELLLALKLDPNEPTGWLYAAVLNQQQNRLNQAIDDLRKSQTRNDNRSLFRSRLLLDEDLAVRSANLAAIYRDVGMTTTSLGEAARAVAYDYQDPSAHLFLAGAYNDLRDPTRFNLRYETAWFNELLLANMLAPVGAGVYSPNISQYEYTRLFTKEGFHLSTLSDYRSDGQCRQLATQSGFFGRTAWSLDLDSQFNQGVRPNNDLDRIEWYSQIKQQVTDQDTALILTKFQEYHSGDNFQYLDPLNRPNGYIPSFRFDEEQKPIALGGWRHEWSPVSQSLALAGRLENDQRFRQDGVRLLQTVTGLGPPIETTTVTDLAYRGRLEIYTGELNQLLELCDHRIVCGGRFQGGLFDTQYRLSTSDANAARRYPLELNQSHRVREDFARTSVYAYDTWAPCPSLAVTAGLAWDDLAYPANFRLPPLQPGRGQRSGLLPKAALVWTPLPALTVRGMYARSLGGVSLDQSYTLEPVQLAGFSQAFRTIIPESVIGSISAPSFEVTGVGVDFTLPARTYLALRGDFLQSDVDEHIGMFTFDLPTQSGSSASTLKQFRFDEKAATLALDKLIGNHWSAGGSYRFQRSDLEERVPLLGKVTSSDVDLHTFAAHLRWNHSSGLFGRGSSQWFLQDHRSTRPGAVNGGEDTCQLDLQLGWRSRRRQVEVSVGVLNLLGKDYQLDPLSSLPEFARERVYFGQVRLNL
jgi:tetratricopeptide (TPR) repeat protein